MAKLLVIALMMVAGNAFAQSAPPQPNGLTWLNGEWTGSGSVHGSPSQATLSIGPALAGRFVELSYRFHTTGDRPFTFEGRGIYKADDWRGQWFDSTGAARVLTGAATDGELVSHWGDDSTERGRSEYRRADDGALEVTDHVLRPDGQWHVFARHRFVRKD